MLPSREKTICDAREFEEALATGDRERAAGLYSGPLLDGFFLSDAPEFERWVDAERDRLARSHARVLEALAEEREKQTEWVGAAEW